MGTLVVGAATSSSDFIFFATCDLEELENSKCHIRRSLLVTRPVKVESTIIRK
jgi:hypothetical protein